MQKTQKIVFTVLVVTVVASLSALAVMNGNLQNLKKTVASGGQIPQEEIDKIVGEVSKFMLLPQDETPAMATVTDPVPLKDQPFFAQASVGDIVLIYPTSRKAVLWRPSSHKIIEVSALNLPEATASPSATPPAERK